MLNIPQTLAKELSLKPFQVENALGLFAEGATIPFIARYRKERTGEMNETQLRELSDRFTYLTELEERKSAISDSYTHLRAHETDTYLVSRLLLEHTKV